MTSREDSRRQAGLFPFGSLGLSAPLSLGHSCSQCCRPCWHGHRRVSPCATPITQRWWRSLCPGRQPARVHPELPQEPRQPGLCSAGAGVQRVAAQPGRWHPRARRSQGFVGFPVSQQALGGASDPLSLCCGAGPVEAEARRRPLGPGAATLQTPHQRQCSPCVRALCPPETRVTTTSACASVSRGPCRDRSGLLVSL